MSHSDFPKPSLPSEPLRPLSDSVGQSLLTVARQSIEAEFGGTASGFLQNRAWPQAALTHLRSPGASFVTLTHQGQLRGCIGSLTPHRTLLDDVAHNARAAAFQDPRFPPVCQQEWPSIRIEVSVLGQAERLTFIHEHDATTQLKPHLDGVILESGPRRATFLPQVWAQLPDPQQFLAQLKIKAGLAADAWPSNLCLYRYSVQHWTEEARS